MKWSEIEFKEAERLLKNGFHFYEIAEELGRTTRSIKNKLNKAGITWANYNQKLFDERRCEECKNIFVCNQVDPNRFCSQSCAAKFNNRRRPKWVKNCLNCGRKIGRQRQYCSHKCNKEFFYNEFIKKWKNGAEGTTNCGRHSVFIRKFLFKKFNNECSKCGWKEQNPITNKVPLEVEHIDGNYLNNKEENLTLLCPNCHALTPTYKALNYGKGRHKRRERYKTGKSF